MGVDESGNDRFAGGVDNTCAAKLFRHLGEVCLREGKTKPNAGEQVQASRTMLKNKVIALSDLLAVFRAV